MDDRLLHESVYRGPEVLQVLKQTRLTLCGIGAVGSNLAMNLARQGFSSFTAIDFDRVDPQNLSTQIWSEAEIGLLKVRCLENRLFENLGLEMESVAKKLTDQNAKKLLKRGTLLVDSFDNSTARQIVATFSEREKVPCLHVGLNAGYAEVIWNDQYTVPSGEGEDVCDYPLARNLIMMAVAVASESIIRFVVDGNQLSYTITLNDFAVREL